MGQLGMSTARLQFEYIGAPAHEQFVDTIKAMDAKLRKLHHNPAARAR